jgi:hypothetical protein
MSEAYGPWGNNTGSTTKAISEGEPTDIQSVLPENFVLTQKK